MQAEKPPTASELKLFLKDMGVTQKVAAEHGGVSERMLRRYLNGSHDMTIQVWTFMRRSVMQHRIERARESGELK